MHSMLFWGRQDIANRGIGSRLGFQGPQDLLPWCSTPEPFER